MLKPVFSILPFLRLLSLAFGFLSSGIVFAGADILYDFGVQDHSPEVTSTNPALLANCESQTMSGFSCRNVQFQLQDGSSDINVVQEKGRNYGSIDFGMCERLLRWFSYGIHVNASALSFRFETQNQDDPIVFPYGKDTLPIASGGIGLKLTEAFSAGFAWKMVEKVDVTALVPVSGLELQADIEVGVRPVISWLLGGSYRIADYEFYYSYSPEIRGDLDFEFDVDVDLPFISYDIGVLQLQTAISYIPTQNRFGVLGSAMLGNFGRFDYDLGVVQSQWSKLNDPFLNVEAFGNLDDLLFTTRALNLQDTYEPYIVIHHDITKQIQVWTGYSYRRNPIKEMATNEPLVGANMHSLKFGAQHDMVILNKHIIIGSELVVGFMNGSQETSSTQSLDGYYTNLQGFIRIPIDR